MNGLTNRSFCIVNRQANMVISPSILSYYPAKPSSINSVYFQLNLSRSFSPIPRTKITFLSSRKANWKLHHTRTLQRRNRNDLQPRKLDFFLPNIYFFFFIIVIPESNFYFHNVYESILETYFRKLKWANSGRQYSRINKRKEFSESFQWTSLLPWMNEPDICTARNEIENM